MNEERDTVLFPAQLRGKTHSSLCGQKAYLNFEVKDAHRSRLLPRPALMVSKSGKPISIGARPSAVMILEFKVQIRSGQPCDEWENMAGRPLSKELSKEQGVFSALKGYSESG